MLKGILSVFLGAVSAHAGLSPSLSVEKPVGYAWFDLEHFGPDTTVDGTTIKPMIRSELNFPLDHFRLNLGLASWRPGASGGEAGLRTEAHAWTSISPAFLRMRDEDWVGMNASRATGQSTALMKFSDTYSTVESFLAGGGISREITALGFLGARWAVGFGLAGSYFTYEVFGLEGKQASSSEASGWVKVALPGSLLVGTYRNQTGRATVGLRSQGPLLGLWWESRLHPLLYSHSFDDHILRKKHIVMDCWGAGGNLEASLPWFRGGRGKGRSAGFTPFLRMELDRSWGKMVQTYYADSPDTPDDETGRSSKGIRTTVNHWLVSAGVRGDFGPR